MNDFLRMILNRLSDAMPLSMPYTELIMKMKISRC